MEKTADHKKVEKIFEKSLSFCAVGGVPGDGEIPMETVRNCPSAESPMKIMSGVLDKYGQHTKRQTKYGQPCADFLPFTRLLFTYF